MEKKNPRNLKNTKTTKQKHKKWKKKSAKSQVIKGWTEAMQKMVQGDQWELYIPSDLAYGDMGSPPDIPGGATLVS
jgi:hypothetical protein